jgi:hypothetical protein
VQVGRQADGPFVAVDQVLASRRTAGCAGSGSGATNRAGSICIGAATSPVGIDGGTGGGGGGGGGGALHHRLRRGWGDANASATDAWMYECAPSWPSWEMAFHQDLIDLVADRDQTHPVPHRLTVTGSSSGWA